MHESEMIDDQTLELKDLLHILRKRYKLILSIFLVASISATVISFSLPKVYQAETSLRIKQSLGLNQSFLGEHIGNPKVTKEDMATYTELIKSRTVVEEVIQQIEQSGQQKCKLNYETVVQGITISQVPDTTIMKIRAVANTPDMAQKLATLLVPAFQKRIALLSSSEQLMMREFFSGQLQEAKLKLDQSEKMLRDYQIREKIVAPSKETKLLVFKLAEINRLVAKNHTGLASTRAWLDYTNLQLINEPSGFIAKSTLIQQLKSKQVELEVKWIGLLQQYTENQPQVQSLRDEINEIKKKLNSEIDRVVNTEVASLNPVRQGQYQAKLKGEAELTVLEAQKGTLDVIVAQEEKALVKLPLKEQGLARVMLDVILAQEIYVMLAKRYEEAGINEIIQPVDFQIIDRAVAPDPDQPIKPQKRQIVLIGAFLGLLCGSGLAFCIEYFNKTIVDCDDVHYYLDLPVFGNIPEFDAVPVGGKAKSGWGFTKIKSFNR